MKTHALAWPFTLLACLPLALHAGNDISKVNSSVRVTANSPAGDVSTVNGSIDIEDGVTAEDVQTVNGSIDVGRNASVESIETVNGGISLDQGARARSVDTVNGRLRLEDGVQVSGNVGAVNGSISLRPQTKVNGSVSNVNGSISLDHATVGDRLKTVMGDIEVGTGSRVDGGILVEKPSSNWGNRPKRNPRIVIAPGAVVNGTLKFEHEVDLYVSERATVGEIVGANAVRFSGERP
jgi:DUF4097 and DUF4098 domain-containing protein YvlB